MTSTVPDPVASAKTEAAHLRANFEMLLEFPINRILRDAHRVDRRTLLDGLEHFHRERMTRIPSPARFPDARPWVEFVLESDRILQAEAAITDRQMAIYRSLGAYLTFRGFVNAQPITVEKCRVAYIPDTDQGTLHIKNVDDLPKGWKKRAPFKAFPAAGLVWDGTGSGLHIDDEPDEIFPLPVKTMCMTICDDVPSAVQFLSRYSSFWGKANVVLYDAKKRSAMIEKCSFNHIQVYWPGANGRSHVSGMVCRDPQSPIGQHQQAKRDQYRKLFGVPDDGSDVAFWNASATAEGKLARLLAAPALKADDVCEYFTRARANGGLNKSGDKVHPDQPQLEYTLLTTAQFNDQRKIVRWQRAESDLSWPAAPEVYQFSES